MLDKIIRFSLTHGLWVLVGALLIIAGGLYTTNEMDIDVFPDLTAPTVVVMTEADNLAAEEVERLVTFPIETAVNGATDVRRVRSSSMPGYSFVWVEFDWGTDIFKARQIVSEKMVTLSESLPPDVTPVLAPQSSVMGEIMFIGLQATTTSMMDLRTLAEWVVKPAILATGGVSQVTIIGGDYKQYQVLADPVRMNAYDITLSDIEEAVAALGENASGGVVRQYGNEYVLRGMSRTTDLQEMEETLLKVQGGKPVFLGDVAKVQIGSAVKMGYASQNAKPAVLLSISKQPNVNTLEVTENIEKRMRELQASLPSDVVLDMDIFKQADFIEASVHNVGRALLEGAVFVIVILFLFLGSFRTTLISILAIPLSLLGTMIVLYFLGMDVNTMTLGGMCIAIGSLIDDAIIDVENVYQRLRENHLLPKSQRRPVPEVVFKASVEIRASILNATFIIIVAFIPLFFLSGMEGRMLKPLGVAYIVSLLMSLLVAMTVTPLLSRYMLGGEKYLSKQDKAGRFTRWLRGGYTRSLAWALNHKKTVVGTAIVLLLGTGYVYTTLGHGFLPDFNEGSLTISVVTQPGISLDENQQVGNLVETQLLQIPEVRGTARRTGRGELDEHSQAINSAEIEVQFKLLNRSREAFMEDVRAHLAAIPGIASTVGQPLGHRIDHMLSGTRANIAIKLFGTDLSQMFRIAHQIQSDIADIEGLVDVSVEQQTLTPEWHIRPDRAALARYGISLAEFNDFVQTAFAGKVVAQVYEGQRSFDLMVRLLPDYTNTIEGVRSALIATKSGKKVTLEEVAEIVSSSGANAISRENVERKIVVSANVAGRDLQGAVDDIEKTIREKIVLPEGYHIVYGGQFENARTASRTLLLASLAALLIVFMLLYAEFKDVSLSAIVLLNLPLALIGGIAAIWLTSGIVSIPSIIGFITLFGIATRNGILLISRYRHLQAEGLPLRGLICKGSADRLNPILMTALTSALALVPLILNGDQSGNEIQSPMAVVVLGGLLTSTLLNIYVIPVVYEWFRKRQIRRTPSPKPSVRRKPSRQTISGGYREALSGLTVLFVAAGVPSLSSVQAQSAKLVNSTIATTPVSGLSNVTRALPERTDTVVLPALGEPQVYADARTLMADLAKFSPVLSAMKSASEAEKLAYKTGLVPDDPEIDFSYKWGPHNGASEAEFEVTQGFEFPTVYTSAKKLSDLHVRNADLRYQHARLEWYVEVRQLCLRVIYYNAMEELWRVRMQQADTLLMAFEKAFKYGETNSLDMNKARMRWVKLRNEYQNLRIERENLEMTLSRMMGGVPVRLLQADFDAMVWPADFESWYREVSIWHPALMLSEGELDASKQQVSLSTSHALPSFKVGYKGDNVFGTESLHGLVVGMRVPIWANKNKVKQAKQANVSAEMSLKDVQLALRAKYTTLYAKAAQLQQTVEEYRKTIAEAGNTALLTKALRAGEMSLLEYLVELDYLFELYTVYWEARRDLALIYAEWEALEAQR